MAGCFFHFSKCVWRRVQMKDMTVEYMDNSKFKDFVRCCVAIAHCPLDKLNEAIEHLKGFEFEDKLKEFQDFMIKYLVDYWIEGPIPPSLWNCFRRKRDNTNNHSEGYNSKLNRELKQVHPTPWISLNFITKQITLSETDAMKADSGIDPRKQRRAYRLSAKRREKIKKNFTAGKYPIGDLPNLQQSWVMKV